MPKHLLPLILAGIAVVRVLPAPDRVTIVGRHRPATAACPDCRTPSRRVHGRYARVLGDLPWQGRPVRLCVQARRFRRLNPSCPRRTFAERLGMAASPDTLLRMAAACTATGGTGMPPTAPRVLAVDD